MALRRATEKPASEWVRSSLFSGYDEFKLLCSHRIIFCHASAFGLVFRYIICKIIHFLADTAFSFHSFDKLKKQKTRDYIVCVRWDAGSWLVDINMVDATYRSLHRPSSLTLNTYPHLTFTGRKTFWERCHPELPTREPSSGMTKTAKHRAESEKSQRFSGGSDIDQDLFQITRGHCLLQWDRCECVSRQFTVLPRRHPRRYYECSHSLSNTSDAQLAQVIFTQRARYPTSRMKLAEEERREWFEDNHVGKWEKRHRMVIFCRRSMLIVHKDPSQHRVDQIISVME